MPIAKNKKKSTLTKSGKINRAKIKIVSKSAPKKPSPRLPKRKKKLNSASNKKFGAEYSLAKLIISKIEAYTAKNQSKSPKRTGRRK